MRLGPGLDKKHDLTSKKFSILKKTFDQKKIFKELKEFDAGAHIANFYNVGIDGLMLFGKFVFVKSTS